MTLDFSLYRKFVDNDDEFDALKKFEALWFTQKSRYEDNTWYVSKPPDKDQRIDFECVIGPSEYLTERSNAELLAALKTATYLVRSLSDDHIGGLGGESQYRFLKHVLNFVRFLRLHGINSMSSINQAVFERYLENVDLGALVQLDVPGRLRRHLEDLSEEEIVSKYGRERRRGGKPELAIDKICEEVGVSYKASSQSPEIAKLFSEIAGRCGLVSTKYNRQNNARASEKAWLSQDAIRKELTSIQKLMSLTIMLPDLFPSSMRFQDQFFSCIGVSPGELAKKKGSVGSRTRSIPQRQFFFLMDRAIRWVVDYSGPLIELSERYHRRYLELSDRYGNHYAAKLIGKELASESPVEGPGSPGYFTGFSRHRSHGARSVSLSEPELEVAHEMRAQGHKYDDIGEYFNIHKSTAHRLLTDYNAAKKRQDLSGINLGKAVYHFLPTACLLVLYAFSARREHEIEGLVAGATSEGPRGPQIDFYAGKTFQEQQPFPASRLMVKAVNILEHLSEPVRSTEDNRILQFPSFSDVHSSNQLSLRSHIREFCRHIEIPDIDELGSWQFSEHQFRRFFALMYFYRYDNGDLSTLSWHLRHTDWEMTMQYLTDPRMQGELDKVMRERIYEFVCGAAGNTGDYHGPMSSELANIVSLEEGQTETRIEKLIEKKISEIAYVVDIVPPGACFGRTPGYAERGNCFSQGRIYPEEGCSKQCDGCPNLLAFENAMEEQELIVVQPAASPMVNALMGGE